MLGANISMNKPLYEFQFAYYLFIYLFCLADICLVCECLDCLFVKVWRFYGFHIFFAGKTYASIMDARTYIIFAIIN